MLQPEKYDRRCTSADECNGWRLSGQLWGVGLNNNMISSVKNENFISEPRDGFYIYNSRRRVGICRRLCSYCVCSDHTGVFGVARKQRILPERICCGMYCKLVGFQSSVNIAGSNGLFPNTGVLAATCKLRVDAVTCKSLYWNGICPE